MKLLRWLEGGLLYMIVIGALLAGLAASFGREREGHQDPDRRWWLNRLLILPVLAITAIAAAEALSLSLTMAAFVTAMLSLGGFDALRWVESRWRAKAEALSGSVAHVRAPVPAPHPVHRPTVGPNQPRMGDPRLAPLETLRDVLPLEPLNLEDQVLLGKVDACDHSEVEAQ